MERATRIELATSAWEADVLPLNYARIRLPNYYPIKSVKSQVFCGKTDLKFCERAIANTVGIFAGYRKLPESTAYKSFFAEIEQQIGGDRFSRSSEENASTKSSASSSN